MSPLTLLVVAAIMLMALAVLATLFKAKFRDRPSSSDTVGAYELRESVFTPAERSFAGVLDGALPDGVTWLAKVRLGDVFKTRKGLSSSQRASAANRIDRKHVDFLLVRSSDLAPLAGIELDDRSHDANNRKQRDAFVDEVFRSCSLPLIHVPAQAAYNSSALRATITDTLNKSVPTTPKAT